MVDQLSAKWLEAASEGICPTPNLDRLRSEGVTFNNTISSNPVCCPTRATIATGLTTRGHGVLENGYVLDPALPTFMQILQRNGWQTAALGKVHFRPHFAGLYPDYMPYGFDVTHITEDARGGEWLDWVESDHPEHYESVLATIWPSHIPEYAEYGLRKIDLAKRIREIRRSFQWTTDEYPRNTGGTYALPFPEEVSQTNWITGHSLDFIEKQSGEQPFFAQISYVQPHSPFAPPGQYLDDVNEEKLPEPLPAGWVEDPDAPRYFRDNKPVCPDDWRYGRKCYFADVVHLDAQLGRVLEILERKGMRENSFVVFLSDHGELLHDHGFSGKEERHYDACIRVPLIISGPGLQQGTSRNEFVQLEDICPTILDMADCAPDPMPKIGPYLSIDPEDIPVLPGRSLLPLCRGDGVSGWRDSAYCESYNRINSNDYHYWVRSIRTADYRYSFYAGNSGEQLFDLKNDPDEQNNLCRDAEYTEIRQDLRDRLMELIVQQDYPKTRRNLFSLGVH